MTDPAVRARPVLTEDPVMAASLALFAAIALTFLGTKDYFPAPVVLALPLLLAAAILVPGRAARGVAMAGVVVALFVTVAVNRYSIANHGYMLLYAGVALTIALSAPRGEAEALWRLAAAWLLGLLMGVALVQKLASPNFMSGDLVGMLILDGEAYSRLLGLFWPDWPEVVESARAAVDQARIGGPEGTAALPVPEGIRSLALVLTWLSLLAQAGLEGMLVARRRVGIWLHVAILSFVAMIYVTRPENVFLAVNCLLGLALTDQATARARPWYLAAGGLLLAAQVLDLRPAILS